MFTPGMRVMLVYNGPVRGLYIVEHKVKSVAKTGHVRLENSDQIFRSNGTPTGKRTSFHPPRLQLWDDALWQRYQIERQQRDMVANLHHLADVLRRKARGNREDAVAFWESLPFDVRRLIEQD